MYTNEEITNLMHECLNKWPKGIDMKSAMFGFGCAVRDAIESKAKCEYKHCPKTKGELIEAIEEELSNGNTDLNFIGTSTITNISAEQQLALNASDWDGMNGEDMVYMLYGLH